MGGAADGDPVARRQTMATLRGMFTRHVPALAAAVLTGAASAQVAVGTPAPEFDFQASFNDAPASFAEFEGKLVLVEFFATW